MSDESQQAREAVERAEAETLAISGKQKKTPAVGPIRYNLEAFGVAILGAVLLKWFCIEAFAIPTSSMQPTLMGSVEAGIYDRLLVNKLDPVIREPQRWDVTVFSYPLQNNQNYVKRLVGLPGEKLYIGGGNLYSVTNEEDGSRSYEILRKPDRLQNELWKEVYPARRLIHEEEKGIGSYFFALPKSAWEDGSDPGSFVVDLRTNSENKLRYLDRKDGGLVNRVFDGYAIDVSREIRAKTRGMPMLNIVPDARIEAVFTPEKTIDELVLEVVVERPQHDKMSFALVIANGSGKLQVRKGGELLKESGGKTFELVAGEGRQVGLAHVDDELLAWRDGTIVERLDLAALPAAQIREGCALRDGADGDTAGHSAMPQITIRGKGKVAIDELTISRDLHYTPTCHPGMGTGKLKEGELIEIPEDHYFMMGDNTLQSIDSRGWTAITIGVLPDGTVIHPDEVDNHPEARRLRGNARIVDPSTPPDRDETPVVLSNTNQLAMIDEYGEIHALQARAFVTTTDDKRNQLEIQRHDSNDPKDTWNPPEEWIPFVPRKHIRGRALVIFWRWPFPRFSPIR